MVNSPRLLEERFAIGLRLEAISLQRWRFEVRGSEIRRLQLPKALLVALISDFRIPPSQFPIPHS
jgi:hypothetical protein